jgi:hypothetical protein
VSQFLTLAHSADPLTLAGRSHGRLACVGWRGNEFPCLMTLQNHWAKFGPQVQPAVLRFSALDDSAGSDPLTGTRMAIVIISAKSRIARSCLDDHGCP